MSNAIFEVKGNELWLDIPEPDRWFNYIQKYRLFNDYNNRPHYDISGSHNWKDGDKIPESEFVVEDQHWTGSSWWPNKHLIDGKVKAGTKTRTVAIPLPVAEPKFYCHQMAGKYSCAVQCGYCKATEKDSEGRYLNMPTMNKEKQSQPIDKGSEGNTAE